MTRPGRAVIGLAVLLAAGLLSCSDTGDNPTPGSLSAVPSSVNVGQGIVRNVIIGGGTRPYSIAEGPNPGLATAVLASDTLTITGVTVATGSTSVKVKDSAPSPGNEVRVSITKTP